MMASYVGLQSRPGGLSDEEEEDDDDYPVVVLGGGRGFSEEDDEWSLKPSESLQGEQSTSTAEKILWSPSSAASVSTYSPQSGGGVGRGRGRGRGVPQQQQQFPVETNEENLEERGHSWGGSGGYGRGRSGRHRRQRSRSGSSSPSRSDKQKLKEALLRRVPDFGGGPDSFGREREETVWAKEVSRNLKFWYEQDQKIKTAKEFQTSKEARLELSLIRKLSEDEGMERDCKIGGGKRFLPQLQNAFKVCEKEKGWNVASLGLFLIIKSSDFLGNQGKNQAQTICVELDKYLQTCHAKAYLSDDNLKKVAFEAAVFQRKESLMKLMLQCYQLAPKTTPSPLQPQPHQLSLQLKTYLIQEIGKLCQQAMYTEACLCVHHLQLHDMFDIHPFLLPLVLQDKLGIVEEYLEGCPSQTQQKELLKFLDSQFSIGSGSVYGNLLTYKMQHKVPDTKDDKLNHKPIGKLIKRFRTKYNLGFDCCPNIGRRQRFGELRHLFGRRYEKNEMSQESFNELIEQMAEEGGGEEDDKKMREDIINYFVEYGDFKEAARWILKFDMFWMACSRYSEVSKWFPADKVPKEVQYKEECWEENDNWKRNGEDNNCNQSLMSVEEMVEEMEEGEIKEDVLEQIGGTKSYFCHPFPPCFVYMITEPHQVIEVCKRLEEGKRVTQLVSGFDSEWKPIMSKATGAALVQVAFEDSIHIFDVISLKESIKRGGYQGACPWTVLRKAYFENEKILKLGFDLRNDVKMLTETVTEWKGMSSTWRGMLDLSSLKNLILKECPHIFQGVHQRQEGQEGLTGGKGESGLSELVYLCLGKSLSKEEQMSDWEKRPLRDSQVQYAASDAYCLISVYRTLEKLCGENGVDLERIKDKYLKGCGGRGGAMNGQGEGGNVGAGRRKRGAVEVVLELLEGGLGEMTRMKIDKEGTGFVKLVVDNMLLGLGRYLRGLGFDTVMLENGRGHEDCVEYVKKGGRTIITRGIVASGKITQYLEEEDAQKMYNVKSESTADQLEEICNHFRVALSRARLFTICFRCNSNEFIKASTSEMFNLMETSGCRLIKMPKSPKEKQEALEKFKEKSLEDMILFVKPEEEHDIKEWKLLDENSLRIGDSGKIVLTQKNVRVELTRLQIVSHILDQIYICNECGKCYWSSLALEGLYNNVIKERLREHK